MDIITPVSDHQVSNVLPNPKTLPPLAPRPKRRLWLWLTLGIVVFLVAASLVAAYFIVLRGQTKWGNQLQDQVWQHLVETSGTKAVTQDVSMTYQDSGSFDFVPSKIIDKFYADAGSSDETEKEQLKKEAAPYAFTLSQLRLALTASGFVDLSDASNPKIDLADKATVANNGQEYSANVDFKLQDKTGFTRYDLSQSIKDSQLGKQLESLDTENYFGQWIKVITPDNSYSADLDGIKKSVDDAQPYRDILKGNRFLSIKSFKGISKINGQWTAHYELQLDKDKFRTVIKDFMDKSASSAGSSDETLRDFTNQVTDIFVDKLELKNYEVWVGLKDRELYKSTMTTNAISLTKSANDIYEKFLQSSSNPVQDSLDAARRKARDAKRVADVRQMASALELYYNDHNGYPAAVGGQPKALVGSIYISALPTSPAPAEAPCTDYNNVYWYEVSGTPTKDNGVTVYPGYNYYFCLSQDTAGYKAGQQKMTPNGIVGETVAGYSGSSSEVDYEKQITDLVLNTLRQLNWDAELKIDTQAQGYGVSRTIDLPTDFVDPSKSIPPTDYKCTDSPESNCLELD